MLATANPAAGGLKLALTSPLFLVWILRRRHSVATKTSAFRELVLERTARLGLELFHSVDDTFEVVLCENELEPLQRPVAGSGGMQSLLRSLQRLREGRIQKLTPEMAEMIVRRASWSQGGFQGRLQPLAQRLLAEGLSGSAGPLTSAD